MKKTLVLLSMILLLGAPLSSMSSRADTRPPSVPEYLEVGSRTDDSITLRWDSATDDRGVTGYEVTVDGEVAGTTRDTTFTVRDLPARTTISVSVCALDAAGNRSASSAALTASTRLRWVGPVDVSDAELSSSRSDIGAVRNCFDGELGTIMRSANVNPAYVQIAFPDARNITGARVCVGEPGYGGDVNSWTLECADTQEDLDDASGSYRRAVPTRRGVMGEWDAVDFDQALARRIWRFTVERTVGDGYVHIPELALIATQYYDYAMADPTNLTVRPFATTAALSWDQVSDPNVAGYAIFRRAEGEDYGEAPTRLAGQNSTSERGSFNDFGLTAGTRYDYKIAAFDRLGRTISGFSPEASARTDAAAAFGRIANLRLLVAIYSGEIPDVPKAIEAVRKAIEFYYRNSLCRLNLEPTFVVIEGNSPGENANMDAIVSDLSRRGVRSGEYDLFFTVAQNFGAFLGGYRYWGDSFGAGGFVPMYGDGQPFILDSSLYGELVWIFVHEVGHALDALSDDQGFYFMSDHPFTNFPLPAGRDYVAGEQYDCVAEILRRFRDYGSYRSPHNGYLEFADADRDGLADDDPRLPGDETRFGSSASLGDSDGDGSDDLREYSAGLYAGSNPVRRDTDGDGTPDGADPTPFCDFSPTIARFAQAPAVIGTIDASWTRLASIPALQLDPSLAATFYAGWDDDFLYFGVVSNRSVKVWLSVDGSGQNGRWQTDGAFAGYTDWNANRHSETAYGDCYSGEQALILDPARAGVQYRGSTLAGSRVAIRRSSDGFTMTACIPRNLGPGIGYEYWPAGTPTIEGLRLTAGRILGFHITYAPSASTDSNAEWRGDWSTLAEMYHFYTAELVRSSD